MATRSRFEIVCPDPNVRVYDAIVDGRRIGSWGSSANAEHAARRALGEDIGADGKPQMVLPGAERASDADIAQRRANAALKPKKAQRPCDAGLFGDSANQQEMKL